LGEFDQKDARHHKAYGDQEDYFDDANTIGWVRRGVTEIAHSGCAVVIANKNEAEKHMVVGKDRAGEIWVDLTKNRDDEILINEDGGATFPVNGGSVSVWALPQVDAD
jgi:alpha-amylase